MSDAQTPAEARAEKQQAAHDNQVKAEKEFAAKLPDQSDAAQGQIAAPVNAKEGTSYPKEGREEPAVGTVEYYTAGTAGDNADPDKVFESRDPNNSPVAALPSEDDQKEAAKAADDSRVKVNKQGENPEAKAANKKEVGKAGVAPAKGSQRQEKPASPDKGDLPAQSGSNRQAGSNSDAGQIKD